MTTPPGISVGVPFTVPLAARPVHLVSCGLADLRMVCRETIRGMSANSKAASELPLLVHLVDHERRLTVMVVGREAPGILPQDTLRLRAEVQAAPFLNAAGTDLWAIPGELERWADELQRGRAGTRVVWSEGDRTPELSFERKGDFVTALFLDTPASGVEIWLPTAVRWSEWIDMQLELLAEVKARYPPSGG